MDSNNGGRTSTEGPVNTPLRYDDGGSHFNEVDAVSKLSTLQSIDRLEHHLPHIVVAQLIADIKHRNEEAKKLAKKLSPLGGCSMTLEVPRMSSNGSNSTTNSRSSGGPAGRRISIDAKSGLTLGQDGMSDLLNTLSSLDELLEEEFSSSSSSSEEGESSSSEDESGAEEEDSDDNDDEPDVCSAAFDDEISDMEDPSVRRFQDDDDELSGSSIHGENERNPRSSSPCSCRYGEHWNGSKSTVRSGSPTPSVSATRNSGASDSSNYRSARMASVSNQEHKVGKLRQGRLSYRRLESDTTTDDRSLSVDMSTLSPHTNENENQPAELLASNRVSAVCFIDISGFTKLSRLLEVEALSEIINSYFQMIASEIKAFGGDILKFAGDALIVEWTKEMLPPGQQHWNVALLAALCSSRLVDRCSDYPVNREGKHICTLNLHCAVGYGAVVGAHCGDMDRMEYLILGDAIRQIADQMVSAKLGEVVASPQAMAALADCVHFTGHHQEGHRYTLAFKKDQKFESKWSIPIPLAPREEITEQCGDWCAQDLEDLQRRMSRYVHAVVYSDEFATDEPVHSSTNRRVCTARTSNVKCGQTQSELRDVFTVFIQPKISGDLNDESAGDLKTLQLLNSIMFIVNSEVTRYKAHLRQFIVDDKGLVVIANFGLRGSTFPNMIEERAIPCIANIKTLLKTELQLESRMGATYGRAYCGVVGGHTRHEYTILGPSVNLAARLMGNASNPGILVDEVVKSKAGERPFKALPPVKAKGYDNLVKIYNPKDNVRKAWKNVESEFVGRKEDIDSLLRTAETVLEEPCASKIVFVSGPYGIGKSYLLSHATQAIENLSKKKGTGHYIARLIFAEDDAFLPFSIVRPLFLGILRRKAHIPSFGDAQTAGHTEELGKRAEVEEAQLYVSLLQICLEAKVPMQYIEMFGGLIFSTKLSDIGTWSDRSRKMSEWTAIAMHLVAAFLHCTGEYGLVLLALDDVSGMDEMSWKILQHLHEKASNLLVIATARNEFDLNINGDFWASLNEGIDSKRFRHLRMTPMNGKDVGDLACRRLCSDDSSFDETISKIVQCQSRGNPLLACEILDVMYRENNFSDSSAEERAFNRVEELLLNRLDELTPVDRSHLNLGAILGLSFAEEDIVVVMEKYNDVKEEDKSRHAESVHRSLQESVEFGILKRVDFGGRIKYSFSHSLWMKTIAQHMLDAWKDKMRKLIDVATVESEISIKYDWDELAKIKDGLSSMQQQNHNILQSISDLRALISNSSSMARKKSLAVQLKGEQCGCAQA